GVHTLEPTLEPSQLQDLLAVSTIPLRALSRDCMSCELPEELSVARAATAEQALLLERVPSSLCGLPSTAVPGMPGRLLELSLSEAEILAASVVIAPGGRIEGATTSERRSRRAELSRKPGVTASAVSIYTLCMPLASQAGTVPPGET